MRNIRELISVLVIGMSFAPMALASNMAGLLDWFAGAAALLFLILFSAVWVLQQRMMCPATLPWLRVVLKVVLALFATSGMGLMLWLGFQGFESAIFRGVSCETINQ